MNAYISWIVKSLVDSLTSCHPLPLIRVLWVVFGEASTSRLEIKFKTCNFYFHQKNTGILAICILVELKHRKNFEKKNYRKPVEHGFTSAGGQEQTHVSVFQSRPWEISTGKSTDSGNSISHLEGEIRPWNIYFSNRNQHLISAILGWALVLALAATGSPGNIIFEIGKWFLENISEMLIGPCVWIWIIEIILMRTHDY